MPDPLTIQLVLSPAAQEIFRKAQNLPEKILKAIAREHDKQNQFTVAHIRTKKLSAKGAETLGVVSGRLRRSIRASKAQILKNGVVSAIGSNVVYAGIHEFGGQTKPHIIKAKNKSALAFGFRGNMIFRKSVKHPGSKIKARAFIRKSFEERKEEIELGISQAIVNAWNPQPGGSA